MRWALHSFAGPGLGVDAEVDAAPILNHATFCCSASDVGPVKAEAREAGEPSQRLRTQHVPADAHQAHLSQSVPVEVMVMISLIGWNFRH